MKQVAATAESLRVVSSLAGAALLALLAAGASLATGLAALGVLPWLDVPVLVGGEVVPWAGMALQVGGTALLLAVAATVPALLRVTRLEAAHRSFQISMEDVARAYAWAHAEDRGGAFRLRHEFDAVRERLAHMRQHPDLAGLEPDVLEVAAQMSVESRKLAETYSDEAVDRARRFLQQRQEEVERARELIARAHHAAREIKRWHEAVSLEEDVVTSRIRALEEELDAILPELGMVRDRRDDNVVTLPATAAE